MYTKVIKINQEHIDKAVLEEAADWIKRKELVAFPTETVYGLGANGLDPEASAKIYAAKGRPSDNPLIVHISEISAHISWRMCLRRHFAMWAMM